MAPGHTSGGRQEIEAKLSALASQQEERLAKHRAESVHLPYVDLFAFPVDASLLATVPREKAAETGAILFYKRGRDVRLGVVNPQQPGVEELRTELESHFNAPLQLYVISHRSLNTMLGRYPKEAKQTTSKEGEMVISGRELAAWQEKMGNLNDLGNKIATVAPTDLISALFAGAIRLEASDIHIEPLAKEARLRYRVDGVLHDAATFGRDGWEQVLSRVKYLADLKLNVHGVPQEGSFVLRLDDEQYDVRVSVLPGGFGEYIVMRLLGEADAAEITLADLGMKERDRNIFADELRQSTGLILTAGPTGSGKTTTIVAALREINDPKLKVITLEDPIEYRVKGIEQTAIDKESGYTFAVGLRSILRQDPDVVFVGEMRDTETAETSIHASMTGHLVFSTIHSNDAPGVLLRLAGMGVQSFVLAPALNLIAAQRLVRVVCAQCAEEYSPEQSMREHIGDVMEGVMFDIFDPRVLRDPKMKFVKAVGCDECRGTGYKGRIGVFEVLDVKDEVEELILQGADGAKVREAGMKTGMTTIAQDAYLKVIAKQTTVEEVERISEE